MQRLKYIGNKIEEKEFQQLQAIFNKFIEGENDEVPQGSLRAAAAEMGVIKTEEEVRKEILDFHAENRASFSQQEFFILMMRLKHGRSREIA